MLRRPGIYMGWVGHRNLGDEVLFEVCSKRFPYVEWVALQDVTRAFSLEALAGNVGRSRSYLVELLSDELRSFRRTRVIANKLKHKLTSSLYGEIAMMGGGTLVNRRREYLNLYRDMRKRTGRMVPVFSPGVGNPEFWSRYPDWQDTRKEWAEVLAELPTVGVRGPVSKELLEDAGLKNVQIAGDPAVFLHDESIANRIPSGKKKMVIGFNCGASPEAMWGEPAQVVEAYVSVVKQLAFQGHQIRFLPVCPSDTRYCEEVARLAGVPLIGASNVLVSSGSFNSALKEVDLIVCIKLHAAILAATNNVPFVMLEYQPKCHDFLLSISWQSRGIRTDQISNSSLQQKVEEVLQDAQACQLELHGSMTRLKQRFLGYCDELEPLLRGN